MNIDQANIGTIVRSNVEFAGVPAGTKGVIVEDYGTGVTIEWKLGGSWKPLRDGFDKQTELQFLDVCIE